MCTHALKILTVHCTSTVYNVDLKGTVWNLSLQFSFLSVDSSSFQPIRLILCGSVHNRLPPPGLITSSNSIFFLSRDPLSFSSTYFCLLPKCHPLIFYLFDAGFALPYASSLYWLYSSSHYAPYCSARELWADVCVCVCVEIVFRRCKWTIWNLVVPKTCVLWLCIAIFLNSQNFKRRRTKSPGWFHSIVRITWRTSKL